GIAVATGIPRRDVEAMTLARYDGTAVRIDWPARTVDRHYLWGRGAGSRYCPPCLAGSGGRWPLAWRLGWCFACSAHRRLLADTQALAGRILTCAAAGDLAAILPADLLAAYHGAAAGMRPPRSRPGFMAPRSAAVAAAGVTAAMTVLGEPGIPAAGAALRWL